MKTIDYANAIPYLICERFNVDQMRGNMYIPDDIYNYPPAIFFFLKKDGEEKTSYERIKLSVESFIGNVEWTSYKLIFSRVNYSIAPKVLYNLEKIQHYEYEQTPKSVSVRELLGEEKYMELCVAAYSDVPGLYQHMLNTL